MKRLFFGLLFIASTAFAADKPKPITILQVNDLAVGLRNLDGHMIVVKQNGVDAGTVMIPWDFNDAKLRLRIAHDLAVCETILHAATDAQSAIFKEVSSKHGLKEIAPNTPEYDEFNQLRANLMDQPAPGADRLLRIKASELKLERNEIAGTVLQALAPILDDDVSK